MGPQSIHTARDRVLYQLTEFGFPVNWRKFQLVTSQFRTCLGLVWDSQLESLSLHPAALLCLRLHRCPVLEQPQATHWLVVRAPELCLHCICPGLGLALDITQVSPILPTLLLPGLVGLGPTRPSSTLASQISPSGFQEFSFILPSLNIFTDILSLVCGFVTSIDQATQEQWSGPFL